MDDLSLEGLGLALVILLLISAFFSMAETAMMACNRYRLRHLAAQGHRGARLTLSLLGQTDRMLGTILLGNSLVNTVAATLVGALTVSLFGQDQTALWIGSLAITFAILVFSEITPKVVGAAHANRLALVFAFLLWPIMRLTRPVVWFVNIFVQGLLRLLRLQGNNHGQGESAALSIHELRSLVAEGSHLIPSRHQTMLVNLFDLDKISVEDVMIPRRAMESINLDDRWEHVVEQLTTSYHTRIPVYEGDEGNIIGIAHLRRLLVPLRQGDLSPATLRESLAPPYFVPAGTSAFAQVQFFQENRQRLGLVVDEYGEVQGLVTLEDILEEVVGEFTTSSPGGCTDLHWGEEGFAIVDGGTPLRELNRKLGTTFPLDGPRTLNGLIIEFLEDIPEAGVGLKLHDVPLEVLRTQGRSVRTVKLVRPGESPPPHP